MAADGGQTYLCRDDLLEPDDSDVLNMQCRVECTYDVSCGECVKGRMSTLENEEFQDNSS